MDREEQFDESKWREKNLTATLGIYDLLKEIELEDHDRVIMAARLMSDPSYTGRSRVEDAMRGVNLDLVFDMLVRAASSIVSPPSIPGRVMPGIPGRMEPAPAPGVCEDFVIHRHRAYVTARVDPESFKIVSVELVSDRYPTSSSGEAFLSICEGTGRSYEDASRSAVRMYVLFYPALAEKFPIKVD